MKESYGSSLHFPARAMGSALAMLLLFAEKLEKFLTGGKENSSLFRRRRSPQPDEERSGVTGEPANVAKEHQQPS